MTWGKFYFYLLQSNLNEVRRLSEHGSSKMASAIIVKVTEYAQSSFRIVPALQLAGPAVEYSTRQYKALPHPFPFGDDTCSLSLPLFSVTGWKMGGETFHACSQWTVSGELEWQFWPLQVRRSNSSWLFMLIVSNLPVWDLRLSSQSRCPLGNDDVWICG